ncbi:MAG: hypothetical protein JST93_14265 [Acidobacteria bacterium]|nr:hypothetical protein [Acidobacteriota bacterium]
MDSNRYSRSDDERLRAIEASRLRSSAFDDLDLHAIADAAWQDHHARLAARRETVDAAVPSLVSAFSRPAPQALNSYTLNLLGPQSVLQRTTFGVFLVFALVAAIGLAVQFASGPANLISQQISAAWPLFLGVAATGIAASWLLSSRYRRIPWFDALAVSLCLVVYFSVVGAKVTRSLYLESAKAIAITNASEKFGLAMANGDRSLNLATLAQPVSIDLYESFTPKFLRKTEPRVTIPPIAAMLHEQAHTASLGFEKEPASIEFRFAQFQSSDGITLRFLATTKDKQETLQFDAAGLDTSKLKPNECATLGYQTKTKKLLFLQPATGATNCAELYQQRIRSFQAAFR